MCGRFALTITVFQAVADGLIDRLLNDFYSFWFSECQMLLKITQVPLIQIKASKVWTAVK